jgi:cytidine deaminase
MFYCKFPGESYTISHDLSIKGRFPIVTDKALLEAAAEAARNAYAPYSHFRVGAALLCEDGTVVTGCNVENRSFGLTNCAERTAVFTARARGIGKFAGLAVVCLDADYPVSPCGACRQVLSEFVDPDFPVIFADRNLNSVAVTMKDLLPHDALHDLADRG